MHISRTYEALRSIALDEFDDIVLDGKILRLSSGDPLKLRLSIIGGSFFDIFL
jgi:hypothetical protein